MNHKCMNIYGIHYVIFFYREVDQVRLSVLNGSLSKAEKSQGPVGIS
jgi:hypothetical protein